MKKDDKILYFESAKIELTSVDFKIIKNDENSSGSPKKIITKDSINLQELNYDFFTLRYERKVQLDPISLFDISVKYEVTFKFSKDTINEYKDNLEELNVVVNEKLEKALLLTNVISRASNIISNITMQLNGNAIITPPSIQK